MEELLNGLATDPGTVIATIRKATKDPEEIKKYQDELKNNDRTIRETQVGNIQKDKTVGNGEKSKLVKAVRIPVKFAKKIVTTSTAFEVGRPATLIPSEENDLSKLIKQIWKVNRLDSIIQKMVRLKKAETQAAVQLYINDLEETSILNKILLKIGLKSQAKEIKVKLLDNTSGIMTPYFDGVGDMIYFMWQYVSIDSEGKKINNVQIWDKEKFHYLNDSTGSMIYADTVKPHGFDRIPIVYVNQEEPEWFDVKELIDRFETALSKAGGSNDRVAHPLLKIFGEIESMPDKDDDGKILQFPIKLNEEGKEVKGDASFLEAAGGNESHKNEVEKLESLIYAISHTPNLSFDNVKGIAGISGIALKLMFLDAMIKASSNEGDNRTMIERILNIMIAGITKTTNTGLANDSKVLFYDIVFNSILPDDLKESIENVKTAIEGGFMSKKTGVGIIAMTPDNDEELSQIELETSKSPKSEPTVIQ